MEIKNEMLWRIYVVAFGMLLFALSVFFKAAKIQVVEGEFWRARADSLYVKYAPVSAERGNIIADDGSLLATSLPYYDIHMDLKSEAMSSDIFNKHVDSLSICLAALQNSPFTAGGYKEKLVKERGRGNRYFEIRKNASYLEMEKIKSFPLFRLGRYQGGLIIEQHNERKRPFQGLAQRSIGYVRDDIKPVGLEGSFDFFLKGDEGQRLMQRVAGGVWIPVNDLTEVEPKRGKDIVTTLNVNIQDITSNALLRACEKFQAEYGTAIVMEVETGKIKAIANLNRTKDGTYWETYNHAIGSSMEPGSTFKLASMMALMEDGLVEPYDSLDLEKGKKKFYTETMVDASKHNLNMVTVQQAFELSSNVGMAKLVDKYYNVDKKANQFIKRLKQFGLADSTGVEIEGEGKPVIKAAFSGDWSGITLPWMSIGYELQLTPLQILTFYNAVANDGKKMKPYLVERIQSMGRVIESFEPEVLEKQIATNKTIKKAKKLLEGVVSDGTATNIKTDAYGIAGKTGTSQVNYDSKEARMKYQSSFAGYFPADNPKYSCIVIISDPKGGQYYGSHVAAPVFKEIADRCYAMDTKIHEAINKGKATALSTHQIADFNVGFKNDIESILKFTHTPFVAESLEAWTVVRAERDTARLMYRKINTKEVPNVLDMGLRDAVYLLESNGLKVVANGYGKVKQQSVKAGTRANGQTVILNLN